jgi:hypothetical protein
VSNLDTNELDLVGITWTILRRANPAPRSRPGAGSSHAFDNAQITGGSPQRPGSMAAPFQKCDLPRVV